MISVLKNSDGFIYAYIEYQVVNKSGIPTDDGDFIYIQDAWIHGDFRGNGAIKRLKVEILADNRTNKAKFVYWNNLKKAKLSPSYPLNRIAKGARHGQ